MPKFSIVIPVRSINDYIRESVPHILNLDFQDFEILIVTDHPEEVPFPKTRVIVSGPVGPAYKRDMAMAHAHGEILAFLDDDAYPRKDWLSKASGHFNRPEVAAVCGPAVTPVSDPFLAKLSGAFYTSYLGAGPERYRYWPGNRLKEVDDYPSVNLLIRAQIFKEIGGFNTHYWPGEDTKLCMEVVKKGYKIIYNPDVFVWHHRRNSLKKHVLQLFNYALHRGFFAKKFPSTSLRWVYFIPASFFLYCLFWSWVRLFGVENQGFQWYDASIILYFGLAVGASIKEVYRAKSAQIGLPLILLFFLSHMTYGIGFIFGLLRKELKQ